MKNNLRLLGVIISIAASSFLLVDCGGGEDDSTPPIVLYTNPVEIQTGVAVNSAINATFSETMDASTISTSTFTLNDGSTSVSGIVTYSGTTATFTPSADLFNITTCTATITTGVRDLAGNPMSGDYTWSFTTEYAAYIFMQTFGGTNGDYGYSLQQTSDGGYIIAGLTTSFGAGGDDVYLIKTDSDGNSLWEKTFGGTDDDCGYSVQQTSDGGYIIAGAITFIAGGGYVYLIKTDSDGISLWEKTLGGAGLDRGFSGQQTSDGGYIIAGQTTSFGVGGGDVYLIKTDSTGTEQWSSTFGGSSDDWGYYVEQTSDGGYIITGGSYSFGAGEYDVYLIKTDSGGNSQWEKTFGGVSTDVGHSVQQTSDGGYIITGETYSFGAGQNDVYLIKTDSDGNTVWEKTFGWTNQDVGYSIQQTSDGGYIISGRTEYLGAGGGLYLIKTNSDGNVVWEKIFHGTSGHSVQQTSDGGYIIGGWDWYAGQSDVCLIKTD
ncbi:MAG: Ig-like domain-containing protein [Planctomycetota bacterium]|jgi:hypothetical protein